MSEYSVTIPETSNEDGVVLYFVHVRHVQGSAPTHGNEWTIKMRYSQLAQLHELIAKFLKRSKKIAVALPQFPPKKWWATHNAAFLNQRRIQLEDYFQQLLKQKDALLINPLLEQILTPKIDQDCSYDDVAPKNTPSFRDLNYNPASNDQQYSVSSRSSSNQAGETHNNPIIPQFQAIPQLPKKESTPQLPDDSNYQDDPPMSFSQFSVVRRQINDQPSFSEEIGSIRRRSLEQSDSENNSSILLFFQQPNQLRQSLPQNTNTVFPLDAILFRNSTVSKASTLKAEANDTSEILDSNVSNSIIKDSQQALPATQINAYNTTLEQYQATQRTYKHEIEKINESNEMSSIIEQEIFLDDDDEVSKQDSSSIDPRRDRQQEISESLPFGFKSSTSGIQESTNTIYDESQDEQEECNYNYSHILKDLSLNSPNVGGGSPATQEQSKSLMEEMYSFLQIIKLSHCTDDGYNNSRTEKIQVCSRTR